MADIDIYSASFVSAGMILGGTDILTAEWGGHLANNTGYLAAQPVSVWQCYVPIGSSNAAALWQDVEDYIFLAVGTWTIYYAIAGTHTANYIWGGTTFAHYFPDVYINGSKHVTGYGTWTSMSGSFTLVSSGEPIQISLRCESAGKTDRICGYVSLFGLREAGVL